MTGSHFLCSVIGFVLCCTLVSAERNGNFIGHNVDSIIKYSGSNITVGNEYVELVFGSAEQCFPFFAIASPKAGVTFTGDSPMSELGSRLWRVHMRAGKGDIFPLDSTLPSNCSLTVADNKTSVTFHWISSVSLFEYQPMKLETNVTISIAVGDPFLTFWMSTRLSLVNRDQDSYIPVMLTDQAIVMPNLKSYGMPSNDFSATCILNPKGFGRWICDSNEIGDTSGDYPSGSVSMQWTSIVHSFESPVTGEEEDIGLYFAAHDGSGYMKKYEFSAPSSAEGATFQWSYVLPNGGQLDSTSVTPYPVVLTVFNGTWYESAMLYRQWVGQPGAAYWTSGSPPEVPKWFDETHLWVNSGWQQVDIFKPHQGDPDKVVEHMLQFQRVVPVPMLLHWYVWDELRFDADYPRYFPAKPMFGEAVDFLQSINISVVPYINGRLFDVNITMWKYEHAYDYAAKVCHYLSGSFELCDVDIDIEQYGSGANTTVMCPATPYWQSKISDVVSTLLTQYHTRGVYVDQIAAAGPVQCADPSHNHTLAGGNYWAQGYAQLLRETQPSALQMNGVVVTESNAEVHMNGLQAFLTLQAYSDTDPGVMVPAFQAIYTGDNSRMRTFGREFFADDVLNLTSAAFSWKLANMFVHGSQLGWFSMVGNDRGPSMALLHLLRNATKYGDQLQFIRTLSDARSTLADVFVNGQLVSPLQSLVINGTASVPYSKPPRVAADLTPWTIVQQAVYKCPASANCSTAVVICNAMRSPVSISYDPGELSKGSGMRGHHCILEPRRQKLPAVHVQRNRRGVDASFKTVELYSRCAHNFGSDERVEAILPPFSVYYQFQHG